MLAPTMTKFRVLFRERCILSFFHAMRKKIAEIPHFRCGYFRSCALFGPGGPCFNVTLTRRAKFRVFVAAMCSLLLLVGAGPVLEVVAISDQIGDVALVWRTWRQKDVPWLPVISNARLCL